MQLKKNLIKKKERERDSQKLLSIIFLNKFQVVKNVQIHRTKTAQCSDLTFTEITGIRTQIRHGVNTTSDFQCWFPWDFLMDLLFFEGSRGSL